MIEELDTIILTEDLPGAGLKQGTMGAAVLVFPDGSCEAEFVSDAGETLALLTLSPNQFRPDRPSLTASTERTGEPSPSDGH